MANVLIGATDLSSLGYAVHGINGRGLPEWQAEKAKILGRNIAADKNADWGDEYSIQLAGVLSAPTTSVAVHTRAQFNSRLRSLKQLIDPELGFQKLTISGDGASEFRWVRYREMDLTEQRPVFKLPFQQLAIAFEALEPYWRVTHAQLNSGSVPLAIANVGDRKTRPKVTVHFATAITTGTAVSLLTFADGFQILWDATKVPIGANDILVVDSENLTALLQTNSAGNFNDVIRGYKYNLYTNCGFPIIPKAGGSITAKHANIDNIKVDYDELYL